MIVQLPFGYFDDLGRRHRDAEVCSLSGLDEELLAEHSGTAAELVTSVLSRCISRVGTIEAVDDSVVRGLTVGDRQFLMLKLREVTFGPYVGLVTRCSWSGCGEKVDIDFDITDVPIRISDDGPTFHVQLSAEALAIGGGDLRHEPNDGRVAFRLPTGADQEDCAPLLDTNPAQALHALLTACVLAVGTEQPPSSARVAELSPLARAEIEAAMADAAAGPAMTMQAMCPSCRRAFDVPLDVADLFFGEARVTADLLYRQIHYLAYHYHWGEAEILSLPRAKRLRYVEMLTEEIEGYNDALD